MKYFKIILLSLFMTFLSSHGDNGHSEEHHHRESQKGSISGSIIDGKTLNPIEYASISIQSLEDNSIITGGISDQNGLFYIDNLYSGNYNIIIEYIGYEKYVLSDIALNREEGIKKNIGKISITQKSINIDAVTVIDDKPLYEFETDKMVYNASEDIITGSGTAEDVLKKVPMVTVDQEGEISLRGNPNVKILVNGRPIRTEVSNYSASMIEKVEVITSPSAKYDPEGMAGIINIELKKGDYDGLNGSVRFNGRSNSYYDMSDMNGLTFYLNYRKDKLNFYSGLSSNNKKGNHSGYRFVTTNYYYLDGSNDSESLNFSYDELSDRYSKTLKMGLDYYYTDELTFNWEFSLDSHVKDNSGTDTFTEPFDATYHTTGVDDKSNYDGEQVFEIIKTFKNHPDKELFFSISHHNHNDFELEGFEYDAVDDMDDRIESTSVDTKLGMYEAVLSYTHPMGDNENFEVGYDADIVISDQKMDFELDQLEGINDFSYNRDIHAIYMEYENKISEKFSIKPSFRYEYVSKELSSLIHSLNDENYSGDNLFAQLIRDQYLDQSGNPDDYNINSSYSTFYPDLHFTYNINEKQSIQFGVSKRVERPGSFGHGRGQMQIRPFPRDIYSEGFLFIGNPYLEPEYSTQYDLSFKSPLPMGFFSSSLFHHEITNSIEWYDDDSYENLDLLTFQNSSRGYSNGISLFAVLAGQVLGGTYSETSLNDNSDDYELNEGSTFMNMYLRASLPEQYLSPYIKWWKFDFEYGFYWMKIDTPTGTLFGEDGSLWANLSISKEFFNRLRVSLSVDNLYDNAGFQMYRTKPFDQEDFDTDTYSSVYETTDTYNERNGRTISLSFKYNFGKLEDEKSKSRRKSFEGDGPRGSDMDMGY